MSRDLVGPVEKAAQKDMAEIADVLDEKAARLETLFRQLQGTEGYQKRLRRRDAAPWTVAYSCLGQCELTAESLREEARQLRGAAADTPQSLVELAEKTARRRTA